MASMEVGGSDGSEHPAARYEGELREVVAARSVTFVLLFTVLNQLVIVTLHGLERYGPSSAWATLHGLSVMFEVAGLAMLVSLPAGVGLFLCWLKRFLTLTRQLGGEGLPWRTKDIVYAFVVPPQCFFQSVFLIRDLHDYLAPEALPPPTRQRLPSTAGYRNADWQEPPPPVTIHGAAIGLLGLTFWPGLVFKLAWISIAFPSEMILSHWDNFVWVAFDFVVAAAALQVVRALNSRLAERYRRLRYTPVSELNALGVRFGDGLRW